MSNRNVFAGSSYRAISGKKKSGATAPSKEADAAGRERKLLEPHLRVLASRRAPSARVEGSAALPRPPDGQREAMEAMPLGAVGQAYEALRAEAATLEAAAALDGSRAVVGVASSSAIACIVRSTDMRISSETCSE